MTTAAQMPTASQPVVQSDPSSNLVFTRAWYRFLGAVSGFVNNAQAASSAITVGASPFSYTATANGIVIVRGGTVTALEYGRGGTFTNLGVIAGPIPVSAGDVLRVTHAGAPTMTLVPQ